MNVTTRRDYKILLEGVDASDLSLSVLRDLCALLVEGSQRAARLAVEGRSIARGALPAWIAACADLRIARYASGSLDLAVSAPPLHEAAPDIFTQQQFFPPLPNTDSTALDLLLGAADDAVSGRGDSDRIDAGLLEVLVSAGGLFSRGSTKLSIGRIGSPAVVIDPSAARAIRAMAEATPTSRVGRVRGVLDAVTVSTRAFVLKLDAGNSLRGFTGAVPLDRLKSLLGNEVVVEGLVSFRPSGDALRIEVDHATLAKPADAIWARLPHVDVSKTPLVSSGPDLESVFGHWPGDESEEDIYRALRELS